MRAWLAFVLLTASGPAFAHDGHVEGVWSRWTWDSWVVVPLALSAILYATGVWRLWRRAGPGRGVTSWQVATFVLGWLSLVVALVSPVHWLGEHLFALHMVEHEIVMV